MLEKILITYGILSLSHLLAQSSIAHFHHVKSRKNKHKVCYLKPKVSVIIPSYNETPEWLADCIDSLLEQKHEGGGRGTCNRRWVKKPRRTYAGIFQIC